MPCCVINTIPARCQSTNSNIFSNYLALLSTFGWHDSIFLILNKIHSALCSIRLGTLNIISSARPHQFLLVSKDQNYTTQPIYGNRTRTKTKSNFSEFNDMLNHLYIWGGLHLWLKRSIFKVSMKYDTQFTYLLST